ncbi:MAG: YgiT-type zinc finger protein [Chloroflexi bacterium]|nr:YgiT-type zinc finger protein [Chloroflexota bacterium]MBU1661674.1 YgiT-type zinc finger protein [Chloroflexota bacterium]
MMCSIRGCSGEDPENFISQVFIRDGKSVVVENIPARVCNVCGDTILGWETVEQLFGILETPQEPRHFLPAYSFEVVAA